MRRNVNRKVFNERKKVSATTQCNGSMKSGFKDGNYAITRANKINTLISVNEAYIYMLAMLLYKNNRSLCLNEQVITLTKMLRRDLSRFRKLR